MGLLSWVCRRKAEEKEQAEMLKCANENLQNTVWLQRAEIKSLKQQLEAKQAPNFKDMVKVDVSQVTTLTPFFTEWDDIKKIGTHHCEGINLLIELIRQRHVARLKDVTLFLHPYPVEKATNAVVVELRVDRERDALEIEEFSKDLMKTARINSVDYSVKRDYKKIRITMASRDVVEEIFNHYA